MLCGLRSSCKFQVLLASVRDGIGEDGARSQEKGRGLFLGRHLDVLGAAYGWELIWEARVLVNSRYAVWCWTGHMPSLVLNVSLLKVKYSGHPSPF